MFLFMALIGCFSRSVSSNPTTRQLSVQTSLDKPQEAKATGTPLPQLLFNCCTPYAIWP
jgi:hypothetical protein